MLLLVLFVSLSTFAAGTKETQAVEPYPDDQIEIIIPFNAGGGSDTLARLVNNYIGEYLGTEMNFVYKPGAGGAVGLADIAKSDNDGYTVGTSNMPHLALQSILGSGDFQVEDFTFLCQMAVTYPIFVFPKESKFNNLDDFIAYAKKNPGKLTIGLPGALGNSLIGFGQLMDEAGIECTLINYTGGADLLTAILGNQIDAAFSAINMTVSNIDDMKPIAVAYTERDALISDIPTFAELGYKVSCPTSRIFLAPAGIAEEKIAVLENAFKKVFENPEFIESATKAAFMTSWIGREDLERDITAFLPQAQKYIDKFYEQ